MINVLSNNNNFNFEICVFACAKTRSKNLFIKNIKFII